MPRRTAVAPWRGNGHVAQRAGSFFEHLDALLDGEEGILDRILENADCQVLEELRAALDEVDVAVGRRVKGAGIEGFHAHWAALVGF